MWHNVHVCLYYIESYRFKPMVNKRIVLNKKGLLGFYSGVGARQGPRCLIYRPTCTPRAFSRYPLRTSVFDWHLGMLFGPNHYDANKNFTIVLVHVLVTPPKLPTRQPGNWASPPAYPSTLLGCLIRRVCKSQGTSFVCPARLPMEARKTWNPTTRPYAPANHVLSLHLVQCTTVMHNRSHNHAH